MTRPWTLLVTFSLLLALGACGGGSEEDGGGTPTAGAGTATPAGATAAASGATATASGHTVEITLWHDNVAATLDAIEGLARRFNASQSEVKVKLAFQGTDAEEMAKVVASLNGGDLPNIVQESEPFTQQLIDSGAMVPVQEFVDKDNYDLSDLNKKALEYFSVDGTLWAMPFGVVFPMLYYNKNVFRDVGLDPEIPQGHRGGAAGLGEDATAGRSRQCDANRHRHRCHLLAPGVHARGARGPLRQQ